MSNTDSKDARLLELNDVADAIDEAGTRQTVATREGLKRVGKALEAITARHADDDEIRAWDRFAAAAILRAPEVENVEELVNYCEVVSAALIAKRRELFDDKGEKGEELAAARDPRVAKLIESAQALEAHFVASKGQRFDLYERAKLLRDRADRELGVTPPEPDKDSPDEKNAAADRRVAAAAERASTNGAAGAKPANGSSPVVDVELEPGE